MASFTIGMTDGQAPCPSPDSMEKAEYLAALAGCEGCCMDRVGDYIYAGGLTGFGIGAGGALFAINKAGMASRWTGWYGAAAVVVAGVGGAFGGAFGGLLRGERVFATCSTRCAQGRGECWEKVNSCGRYTPSSPGGPGAPDFPDAPEIVTWWQFVY